MEIRSKVISELVEINHRPYLDDMDIFNIVLDGHNIRIHTRNYLHRGVIFQLDRICKVLTENCCVYYLSCTRNDFPEIVVTAV